MLCFTGVWDYFQDSLECKVCQVKPQVGISISNLWVCVILFDSLFFVWSVYLLVVMPPKKDCLQTEEMLMETEAEKKMFKKQAKDREDVRIFSILLFLISLLCLSCSCP